MSQLLLGAGKGVDAGVVTPVNPATLSFDLNFADDSANLLAGGDPAEIDGVFDAWNDTSGNDNHANTGGLMVRRADGVEPPTGDVTILMTPVVLTGALTVYAVGKRTAGQIWTLFGREINGQDTCITVYNDNTCYFINNAAAQVTAALSPTGSFGFRLTRDGSNVVKAKASGLAEVTLGTLSGTLTVGALFGRRAVDYSNTAGRFRYLGVKSALLDAGQLAGVDAYIVATYGVPAMGV